MLCPFCQEEIQDSAIKCRHCGEFLKNPQPAERTAPPIRPAFRRPVPRKAPSGTGVFVLGLLGIVLCGVLGIIAWIQGNDYMSKCRVMKLEPDGLAVAGRVMGIIGTILLIAQIALAVTFFGASRL